MPTMCRAASRSGGSIRPPARTIRVTGRGAVPTPRRGSTAADRSRVPGAYDPDLNLVYWGTGNAGPDYNGAEREGDNLYTASIVALDADTGKLRWHYQFTPHDIWDWDSTQMPVLADLTLNGEARKVVLFANRNGFFYVLDRATGKLIRGKPFIETTWAKEIRPDGRPMLLPNTVPSEEGTKVCPDQTGGTNWMPPSFDPARGLFFVTARESCGMFFSWKDDYNPGDGFRGGAVQRLGDRPYSALRAIDATTGERRWEYRYAEPVMGRRVVDRFGSRVCRRIGQSDGVRCEERQEPLALPDRLVALRRGDHLHDRRPPARADAVRHDVDRLRARRFPRLNQLESWRRVMWSRLRRSLCRSPSCWDSFLQAQAAGFARSTGKQRPEPLAGTGPEDRQHDRILHRRS